MKYVLGLDFALIPIELVVRNILEGIESRSG